MNLFSGRSVLLIPGFLDFLLLRLVVFFWRGGVGGVHLNSLLKCLCIRTNAPKTDNKCQRERRGGCGNVDVDDDNDGQL